MHFAFTGFVLFALLVGLTSYLYREIIQKVNLLEMEYAFDRTADLIRKKAVAQGESTHQPDVRFVLDCCYTAKALRKHFSIWHFLIVRFLPSPEERQVELLSDKAPCFLSGSCREITDNLIRCGLVNSPLVFCVYKFLRLIHRGWNLMREIAVSGSKTAEYVISVEEQSTRLSGRHDHHQDESFCLL